MANRVVEELAAIRGHAEAWGLPSPRVRREGVDLDGAHVSALRWGESAPEFVFLHGARLNAHTWNGLLLRLDRPALVLDLPGHGFSSRIAEADYRVSTVADLVARALAAWNVAEAHLVAHSFGSFVASMIAADLPDESRLTILDATPGRMGSGSDHRRHSGTLEQLVESVRGGAPHRAESSLRRGVLLNSRERPDGLREWMWDARFDEAAPARRAEREQGWRGLEGFTGELTLVRGDRGGLGPDELDEFAARLPAAHILTAQNAGHNVHTDAAPWLAEWLNRTTPPPARTS